jgi:hypothetical protein
MAKTIKYHSDKNHKDFSLKDVKRRLNKSIPRFYNTKIEFEGREYCRFFVEDYVQRILEAAKGSHDLDKLHKIADFIQDALNQSIPREVLMAYLEKIRSSQDAEYLFKVFDGRRKIISNNT